jgi:hypothetical protein
MYIIVCIDIAICIILACDVYLPDLQVLKIWDLQAKPVAWEALRSVPDHATKRKSGAVYFWKEARMNSFASVPTTS